MTDFFRQFLLQPFVATYWYYRFNLALTNCSLLLFWSIGAFHQLITVIDWLKDRFRQEIPICLFAAVFNIFIKNRNFWAFKATQQPAQHPYKYGQTKGIW